MEAVYRAERRPSLRGLRPDRRIFRGKRYLPIGLVEAGRGCHFRCEFCAVQSMFANTQTRRPLDEVIAEVASIRDSKKLFFFVDDNITSNLAEAKAFFRELASLGIRWVSQSSINAAHDEEFLDLLAQSGCQGVLIGFESLNPVDLAAMNKSFNTMRGGYEAALANLRKHRLRLYATFIFGYDADTAESFAHATEFAKAHKFYIAAFNHLTPFPGTPLVLASRSSAPAAVRTLVARRHATATTWCRSVRRPWTRKRSRSSAFEPGAISMAGRASFAGGSTM